jgi:hypothetical protein
MRWLEISQPKRVAIELETMPQNMQRPFNFQFLDERWDRHGFEALAMQFSHRLSQRRLRRLEKAEDSFREQRVLLVPFRVYSLRPTGLVLQDFFDIGFEGEFRGLLVHRRILPLTSLSFAWMRRSISNGGMHRTPNSEAISGSLMEAFESGL